MVSKLLLIRYEEIGLKGRNRYKFENKLISNIKHGLAPLGRTKITTLRNRMLLDIGEIDPGEAVECLRRVFGIASFSPVTRVEADEKLIYETAKTTLMEALEREEITPGENGKEISYRVTVKRADKSFPISSMDLASRIGAYLMDNIPGLKVDLHNPRMVVSVDIRQGQAYVFSETIPGPGGLPVGVSGKGILFLSGGIDSPVAGWLAMKRGIEIEAVHFHSFPFTGEKSKEKVKDLCRVLTNYGGQVKLHMVHFTDIQKAIHQNCPPSFRITVMRRFMFRIGQRIAENSGALALVTGESVGQVSSQTLENMAAINKVTVMPVLRPLITYDKLEIIKMAQKIGTYDISIQPYEDCCTLFLPKGPITIKPNMGKILKTESLLDVDGLIEDALEKTETFNFTWEG
ncbi:thiamine biosynthesis protein ThiI [Desulfohalotomaculum tongense]|uniref:tRNA uracil 4-sulfurtransferase ThiI n=1 Tax=Desulforadius tongensis TaxID=1216062 RepID=UPI00195A8AFE|nr:tRNA uracil 4-sulfurtransferase ThiI [Desulforadius tongensis]MBM7854815.1 thiamine biosynthesis protein ThiI [Desulforadius tongensis]